MRGDECDQRKPVTYIKCMFLQPVMQLRVLSIDFPKIHECTSSKPLATHHRQCNEETIICILEITNKKWLVLLLDKAQVVVSSFQNSLSPLQEGKLQEMSVAETLHLLFCLVCRGDIVITAFNNWTLEGQRCHLGRLCTCGDDKLTPHPVWHALLQLDFHTHTWWNAPVLPPSPPGNGASSTSVVSPIRGMNYQWRWTETAAASGVSMKAAHLLTPCWVNSTPAWVWMLSHWPTERSYFMPLENINCGQRDSEECTHDVEPHTSAHIHK